MRSLFKRISNSWVALAGAIICTIAVSHPISTAAVETINITVANNSGRVISHLYTSPPDRDQWGADQLAEGTVLGRAQSLTLHDVPASAGGIKLIAEDQEGCFVSAIISASDSTTTTWNITDELPRDCGN